MTRLRTGALLIALCSWVALACEAPDTVPDTASAPDTATVPDTVAAPDTAPAPPLFERGLVTEVQPLPCYNHERGDWQDHCNHHGSSVAVQADGTVLAVWYHGVGEKSPDSDILWSRKAPGQPWSPVEVLYDDPDRAEGNPVIWIHDQTGHLYLFFVSLYGPTWNDGKLHLIVSEDGGESWSERRTLREALGWMTRNAPVRMPGGELLLPVYDETLYTPSFLWSTDDFASRWEETVFDGDFLLQHWSAIQPTVIVREDGSLFALSRNTDKNSVPQSAREMLSFDEGRTWTPCTLGPVPNDNVAIEMKKLRSGRVVLAFNNSPTARCPLSAALSEDEGRSWRWVAELNTDCVAEGTSYGYTAVAQDPTDESIWVTYTHGRDTIGWVHFNEAWLMQSEGQFASLEE